MYTGLKTLKDFESLILVRKNTEINKKPDRSTTNPLNINILK